MLAAKILVFAAFLCCGILGFRLLRWVFACHAERSDASECCCRSGCCGNAGALSIRHLR